MRYTYNEILTLFSIWNPTLQQKIWLKRGSATYWSMLMVIVGLVQFKGLKEITKNAF